MDGTRLPERKTGTHSTLVRKRRNLRGECLNVVNRSSRETIQMPWAVKKQQQQNKTVEENTRIAWISHITSSPAYSLIQALREWASRGDVGNQASSRSLGKWFVSREKNELAHSLFLVLIEIVIDITGTHEAVLTFLLLDKHFHSRSLVKTFSYHY